MELRIGMWDLVFIYLFPVVAFVVVLAAKLLFLFICVKMPGVHFDFKDDLLSLFEEQRRRRRYRNKSLPFVRFYCKTMLGDNGTQALFLYRVARFWRKHHMGILADFIHRVSKFLTDADISPDAIIGPGLSIYHGSGLVIGKNTRLGANCLVCQGVTTGQGAPQIGDRVKLWAGAKVLGNITIGDDAEVGANAVLLDNLEANTIAVGVPATRRIPKAPNDR